MASKTTSKSTPFSGSTIPVPTQPNIIQNVLRTPALMKQWIDKYEPTPAPKGFTPTPDSHTIDTEQDAKLRAGKAIGDTVSPTKITQQTYVDQIRSLLEPFGHVIGGLPDEFQSAINSLKSTKSSTDKSADDLALQIAHEYSPTITASTKTLSPQLEKQEQTSLGNVYKEDSPTGTINKSLKNLSTAASLATEAAPYEQILKSLIGREQYETMYGSTPMSPQANWPDWLKGIYSGITGITAPAPTNQTATPQKTLTKTIDNLGSIETAAKKSTTKTSPAPNTGTKSP